MIKVTLKTTLTTIQNRHHLSNGNGFFEAASSISNITSQVTASR